ncbi:MAG: S41 family peptidase [Candidatus Omnitrophota bacterium]|jgi:carboxyl-terminal processing protease|nr:MAG: S41 family peptidase [Candidatus Omnitrophota bacterium]
MASPGKKHIGLYFCFLLIVFLCIGIGVQRSVLALDNLDNELKPLLNLATVLITIQKEYVDPAIENKTEELLNGAIHGMVSTLDRYSVYLEKDEAQEFNDQTQGSFGGLGIQIDLVDDWLTVIEPLPGTPAAEAGIIGGDRIVEIESESTKGINIFEAQKKLKGEPGSKVTVTIARRGEKELLQKTITRAIINTYAVEEKEKKMIDETIGYVRLRDFTKDAAVELATAIRDLQGQGMKGMVLDLRDNVGGLLDVAVQVCDLFLGKNKLIVSHRDRRNRERRYETSADSLGNFHLAVLVNEFSASASEIVAGCVQDHKRGILVGPAGHKTFGKGSVQTLIELKELRGAALKLTTAKYYTPSGKAIEDMKGLTPDIFAQTTDEQRFEIRKAGKTGYIPAKFLKIEIEEEEKEKIEEEQSNAPITVDEVFQSKEKEEDTLYDVELFTAYQCLKSMEVLNTVKTEPYRFANSGN